jgi:phosphatidylglycerophosphate synthase
VEQAGNGSVAHRLSSLGFAPRVTDTIADASDRATRPSPRRAAAAGLALVTAGTVATLSALPFSTLRPAMAALATLAVAGLLILRHLPPAQRFGHANAVTLVRAGGSAVFMAFAVEPGLLLGRNAWPALAATLLLLALDGVDGALARQQSTESSFGARFDMEVDALLILALSGIAAGLGKAGPWVLGLGLIRYAFVVAGCLVPRLAAALPPSQRRRAVCTMQVGVLGLMLAPPLVPPMSAALAAAAFAALATSFALDVAWLLRRQP